MRNFSKSAKVFYRANKVLILSSVFVVLLAALGGFWYYQRTAPARERARIVRQKTMVADIIAAGDISQCARAHGIVIGGDNWEAVCKNNIALKQAARTLDLSQCDNLDGNLMNPDLCKRDVVYEKMIKNPDITLCSSLGDGALRDFCATLYWTEAAIAKNNAMLCNQHKNSARRESCKNEFLMNQLVFEEKKISCEAFPENMRSGCAALSNKKRASLTDFNVCLNTGNRLFERACIDRYQAYVAKRAE